MGENIVLSARMWFIIYEAEWVDDTSAVICIVSGRCRGQRNKTALIKQTTLNTERSQAVSLRGGGIAAEAWGDP